MSRPCGRDGCDGVITGSGYCDGCGRAAAPDPPAAPRQPAPQPPPRPSRLSTPASSSSEGTGLPPLPVVELPDPSVLVISDPGPPTGGRRCGKGGCTRLVGVGYKGRRAAERGFCGRCGHPYDFSPRLRPGDVLDDKYQVMGPLAHGGLGWIYLARDTVLDDRLVALKGVININDAAARRAAEEERRHLVALDHPDIVRIHSFVTHRPPGEVPTDYIVMEFVGGRTLRQLTDPAEQRSALGGRLRLEHVVGYGCRILDALEHLHRRGLLYCDMKPDNVIHHGDRVKVIDLGAVRRADDQDSALVTTAGYAPEPPEGTARGWTAASDLHTVGVTLRDLSRAAEPRGQEAGAISFRRVIQRATQADPRARFGSAAQMALQLRGVLRELRPPGAGQDHPEPSALFAPGATLLDAGLGAVPPLSRWTGHPPSPPPADTGRPTAAQFAAGLPVPHPDPDDPAAAQVTALAQADDPRRLAEQLAAERHTPESALQLCRVHLELDDLPEAERWLGTAASLVDAQDPQGEDTADRQAASAYDWRIAWHRALLALAGADPSPGRSADEAEANLEAAERHFDSVYTALPGETAPKLALGYCAERRGDAGSAARHYDAVWQRDRSQGSPAFGLARVHLGGGDRGSALDVLDAVPRSSLHHDAARIAALRIIAGGGAGGPESGPDLGEAARRLRVLYLDGGSPTGHARERLTAEIRETVLEWIGDRPPPDPGPGSEALFGSAPLTGDGLRRLTERSYRELAAQAATEAEHGALVDRANAVRPMTLT
ncbi:tetratricopeptide repeat protein [Peterkaempfera sp. SMS 1(5)a]|uniref:tetratricopeptide repeat protein n=1 Tax=Peterkaempfera podocarpi TaxID=3232308 RepID=UPI00366F9DE3